MSRVEPKTSSKASRCKQDFEATSVLAIGALKSSAKRSSKFQKGLLEGGDPPVQLSTLC